MGFPAVLRDLLGICAWLCFAVGIKYSTALQAGFIALAEPVMAPLWTYLFLGEQISLLSFVGFAVVIVTLVVYNTGKLAAVND